MTPSEKRAWIAAQRRVSTLQPAIQRALLDAFRIIRDSFTDAEIASLIALGAIDRLVLDVLNDALMQRAVIGVRERLRTALASGFRYTLPELPNAGTVDGEVAVMFDHLSPDVVEAIQTLEANILPGLTTDVRDAVRAIVEAGLRQGFSPSTIARQVRAVIGMSPNQVANAVKFEATVRGLGRSDVQIAQAVAKYEKRAVALNAETIARTATLDAYKRGQLLAWQNAVEQGIIDESQLTKTWRGVMDSRERPEHVDMEGETVPFNRTYSNGQDYPGQGQWNCRCLSMVRAL